MSRPRGPGGGKGPPFTVRLPVELWEELGSRAEAEGVPRRFLAESLLAHALRSSVHETPPRTPKSEVPYTESGHVHRSTETSSSGWPKCSCGAVKAPNGWISTASS